MNFVAIILLLVCCVTPGISGSAATKEINEWWKTSVFYQIYPRSFKDNNNDGSGDLQGITSKLKYIKDTGINATWLSPIFKSPMIDAGYDISDFVTINPLFGTMEDFENLLKRAKELDLKIILDFVPNHSSDEHEWFQKSVKKDGKYTDYYVWSDGKIDENGTRIPPNNWKSLFLGSAWEWNDERQQYYFHQFAIKQPDLNYRSPDLVAEMKNILRFWLNKGVAGFRVDAVPYLFEDIRLLDEPKIDPSMPDDKVEYKDLRHIYTQDQNETFDMIYQWRALLDEYAETDGISRVMMTEAYTTIENQMRFYGNETHNGASFSFNFILLTDLNKQSKAQDFANAIDKWMSHMPKRFTANWVTGNHDNHRTATRHGVPRVNALNSLVMMLPGVGVTYNGEEIGMEDGYVTWEETEDPNACNAGRDHFEEYSRDPERTPFQWDNTTNAGFNTGATPWLPVSDKYKTNNLKMQLNDENSHYNIYKFWMAFRQDEVIQNGDLEVIVQNEDVLEIKRFNSEATFRLILNLEETESSVNLGDTSHSEIVFSTSSRRQGTELISGEIILEGNEVIVIKINTENN